MNSTDTKINYFESKLTEIRQKEMELKMMVGQYDKEFKEWTDEKGLPQHYSLLDLIKAFRN